MHIYIYIERERDVAFVFVAVWCAWADPGMAARERSTGATF